MIFGHLWTTIETEEIFGDGGRTNRWLEIIDALAHGQAKLGLIPHDAAHEISMRAELGVDLEAVADETRRSGHSTLGLIRVLQRDLSDEAREWVYYGATVQDVTDTWTGMVAKDMLRILERDLGRIESSLAELARRHREAVMLGRTHGQPGLPITFGFKASVWIAELRRHLQRVREARPRLEVGQLSGAVGTMSAWGAHGPALQQIVMQQVGLGVPDTSWLSARDRVAELAGLFAQATATLAKIGNEVYNLQRPEIGELSEAPAPGVVGSITMPQKRNPERSEHLVTLARLVRADAGLAIEGMVGEHERDGAAWKTEWALLPRACGAAAVALALGAELVAGLRVDEARMRANVDAQQGYVSAEAVMLALGAEIGPRRAHELVHAAAARGRVEGQTLNTVLRHDSVIGRHLSAERLDELLRPEAALGAADELAGRVLGDD